jgi:signal transduction histidine kinase
VRRRLVAAIAGVATAAVLLLAIPLGIVLSNNYRDEELLRLQRDTFAATRAIDLSGQRGDPVELPRSPAGLTIYDRGGRRVAGPGPPSAPGTVRTALRTARAADGSAGDSIEVAVPLVIGERLTGAVRAVRSDAAADRDTRGAWLVLGGVALGIVGAAILAALLLGRRLAAPLERLAGSARRLGEGDFSARAAPGGIAEVDAVVAALNATAQRLDDLVSRERAFSADASHQLRTPLQALRLELEALALRPDPPAELTAALGQVDRLQATIDTLLAVARDAPRRESMTDLRGVLEAMRERWHGPLAARGRPLRIEADGNAANVQAPAAVVAEILDVLVANAERHGRGAVTVTLAANARFVAIDVGDEGPGFGPDPERAFARRTAAADGHGIGLALARSLAHAEGGRLAVADGGPHPVLRLTLPRPS